MSEENLSNISAVGVLGAIKDARGSINNFSGAGWYTGETGSGMKVQMWLNDSGLVDTAFPLYSK